MRNCCYRPFLQYPVKTILLINQITGILRELYGL